MSTTLEIKSSDERLKEVLRQASSIPLPKTPEGKLLDRIQAQLATGATASAQRLARTLKHTFSYPAAMIAVAQAQQQAGQAVAARRTLTVARRQVQQFDKGDHWNGYIRSYYLLEIVRAQVAIDDPAGAAQTTELIDRPEEQGQALRLIGGVIINAADIDHRGAGLA